LCNDLDKKGTILVWNITFERGCLQKLAFNFPKYSERIEAIINRMVDLMIPFRNRQVYNEAFYGSYSIKAVLPVLVPHLSYSDLTIQDGGTASYTYSQLAGMTKSEQSETRRQLLEYCHLDTLAMVEILQKMMTQM
jgi:hypothetical protein